VGGFLGGTAFLDPERQRQARAAQEEAVGLGIAPDAAQSFQAPGDATATGTGIPTGLEDVQTKGGAPGTGGVSGIGGKLKALGNLLKATPLAPVGIVLDILGDAKSDEEAGGPTGLVGSIANAPGVPAPIAKVAGALADPGGTAANAFGLGDTGAGGIARGLLERDVGGVVGSVADVAHGFTGLQQATEVLEGAVGIAEGDFSSTDERRIRRGEPTGDEGLAESFTAKVSEASDEIGLKQVSNVEPNVDLANLFKDSTAVANSPELQTAMVDVAFELLPPDEAVATLDSVPLGKDIDPGDDILKSIQEASKPPDLAPGVLIQIGGALAGLVGIRNAQIPEDVRLNRSLLAEKLGVERGNRLLLQAQSVGEEMGKLGEARFRAQQLLSGRPEMQELIYDKEVERVRAQFGDSAADAAEGYLRNNPGAPIPEFTDLINDDPLLLLHVVDGDMEKFNQRASTEESRALMYDTQGIRLLDGGVGGKIDNIRAKLDLPQWAGLKERLTSEDGTLSIGDALRAEEEMGLSPAEMVTEDDFEVLARMKAGTLFDKTKLVFGEQERQDLLLRRAAERDDRQAQLRAGPDGEKAAKFAASQTRFNSFESQRASSENTVAEARRLREGLTPASLDIGRRAANRIGAAWANLTGEEQNSERAREFQALKRSQGSQIQLIFDNIASTQGKRVSDADYKFLSQKVVGLQGAWQAASGAGTLGSLSVQVQDISRTAAAMQIAYGRQMDAAQQGTIAKDTRLSVESELDSFFKREGSDAIRAVGADGLEKMSLPQRIEWKAEMDARIGGAYPGLKLEDIVDGKDLNTLRALGVF